MPDFHISIPVYDFNDAMKTAKSFVWKKHSPQETLERIYLEARDGMYCFYALDGVKAIRFYGDCSVDTPGFVWLPVVKPFKVNAASPSNVNISCDGETITVEYDCTAYTFPVIKGAAPSWERISPERKTPEITVYVDPKVVADTFAALPPEPWCKLSLYSYLDPLFVETPRTKALFLPRRPPKEGGMNE